LTHAARTIVATTTAFDPARSTKMLDVILLAGGFGFFALSIAYAYACDWL